MQFRARSKMFLMAGVRLAVPLAGCASDSTGDDGTGSTPPAATGAFKQQILSSYTFKPISTTNDVSPANTPAHVFFRLDDDHFQFVHFDNDDVTKAQLALFFGDGYRGDFCLGEAGITRERWDAGFVHFHSAVAPNWDAGHANGGVYDPAAAGWWFRHIGAMDGTMSMMGMDMTIEKGKVFPLMPAEFDRLQPCA